MTNKELRREMFARYKNSRQFCQAHGLSQFSVYDVLGGKANGSPLFRKVEELVMATPLPPAENVVMAKYIELRTAILAEYSSLHKFADANPAYNYRRLVNVLNGKVPRAHLTPLYRQLFERYGVKLGA